MKCVVNAIFPIKNGGGIRGSTRGLIEMKARFHLRVDVCWLFDN